MGVDGATHPLNQPVGTLIAADSISVGYGSVPVVRDITLEVRPGELVALLGANGAGKTTTLLALTGVLGPREGRIVFRDSPRRVPLHRRARGGLAYIAEERSVFMRLSVQENFRVARADVATGLELFPELEEHFKRPVGLLSGGQQQILSVALALARRPAVLVADELSLGLAPLVVDRLITALRQAADDRGVGVLLVEQHVRKALAHADRAYIMRRGRIELEGPARELRSRVDEIEASYLSAPGQAGAGATPGESSPAASRDNAA
jgi:branched-chain amino acid transport system ATP-binding protein